MFFFVLLALGVLLYFINNFCFFEDYDDYCTYKKMARSSWYSYDLRLRFYEKFLSYEKGFYLYVVFYYVSGILVSVGLSYCVYMFISFLFS